MGKMSENTMNVDMIMNSKINNISPDDEKLRQEVIEVITQVDRGEVADIDDAFETVFKIIEKMHKCSPST